MDVMTIEECVKAIAAAWPLRLTQMGYTIRNITVMADADTIGMMWGAAVYGPASIKTDEFYMYGRKDPVLSAPRVIIDQIGNMWAPSGELLVTQVARLAETLMGGK
jgi:hypothetical protein